MRAQNGKHMLHATGNGITEDRGWVEHLFTPTSLELRGSFSAGRIR